MTRVAVIDHGAGNLVSVRHALARVGASVSVVQRADDLDGAQAIVMPGVCASGPAMARLRRSGLADAIPEAVSGGALYLGICLGMQLLFERSDEDGARGFGVLPGIVTRLRDAPRLPHIGWNQVAVARQHPLGAGLPADASCYFVHSYAPSPEDPAIVVAETDHGARFPSVVASGRYLGVQFHPERSDVDGLTILANFVRLAGAETDARPATARPAAAAAV